MLSSSVKMSDSLPHARTVWEDSFGDIETYTNNTLKVFEEVCTLLMA